jgi:hypothetical protein
MSIDAIRSGQPAFRPNAVNAGEKANKANGKPEEASGVEAESVQKSGSVDQVEESPELSDEIKAQEATKHAGKAPQAQEIKGADKVNEVGAVKNDKLQAAGGPKNVNPAEAAGQSGHLQEQIAALQKNFQTAA